MTVADSQVYARRSEKLPTIEHSLDPEGADGVRSDGSFVERPLAVEHAPTAEHPPVDPPALDPAVLDQQAATEQATAEQATAEQATVPATGTDLFEGLPGQVDGGAAETGRPAVLAWWAGRARAFGDRVSGLRRAAIERMPDAADELPAGLATGVRRFLPGSRRTRLVAQAAVLGVLVVGTVGYISLDKSITLTVDGKTRSLHTFSGDVGSLLKKEKVSTTARDLVAPAATSKLHDGDRVVVRYARQLQVTVDGAPATYWTTELTVDSALKALGIRADGAKLSASRSQPIGRDGLALTLSTPKPVTLVADGKKLPVVSTAVTVADLLGEQGLTVRQFDKLSVPATSQVRSGLVVTLTRIDHRRVTATEKVPFGTTKKTSSSMYKGESKTVSAGKDGSRKAVYDVVLTDGKVTSKKLVSATVTTAAVNAVVEVGSKAKPAPPSTGGGGGSVGGDVASLNWAALARCESGGNPRAVNPAGYYGLYQFSLSTWHAMGGSGNPIDNSSAEQTYRAQLLYKRAGVGQWPHCGPRLYT